MAAFIKTFRNISLTVVSIIVLSACRFTPESHFPEEIYTIGLASLIELDPIETVVELNDYFTTGALPRIDSVMVHPSLRARISPDKTKLYLRPRNLNVPYHTELRVWIEEVPYSLITRRPVKEHHTFTFHPQGRRYRNVVLTGEMNNWESTPMVMIDGQWQLMLEMNPGRYQYRIVADGNDMVDMGSTLLVGNSEGGYNSVVEIGNADPSKAPRMFAARYRNNTIEIQVENNPTEVFVLWQNFRLPPSNITLKDNRLQVHIPGDAFTMDRSYIRVMALGKNSTSNDLLIPLQNGIPITQSARLNRHDREASIAYSVMIDRFFNGNPDRDEPVSDSKVDELENFLGGDLEGILQKLQQGYFEELGVNTLWVSPVTQNPRDAFEVDSDAKKSVAGYHGYWPLTFTSIDNRFGDPQVMEELVQQAHSKDISVMIDYVSSYVHVNSQLYIDNPAIATPLMLEKDRQNVGLWDEHQHTTWPEVFLARIDYSNHDVVQAMVDSAWFWIDHYNLDGFRHHAAAMASDGFRRQLTRKIKEEKMAVDNSRPLQMGEGGGSREQKSALIGSGLLDGKSDMHLYENARRVFADDQVPFTALDKSLHRSFGYYGYQNTMGNISGNNHMPRFISYAGGDLGIDEEYGEHIRGNEHITQPIGYKKLISLLAFNMTIPGIPVIMYGDEIGMPGGGGADSHRPMKFDNLSSEQELVKGMVKKLTRLRTSNLAFIFGDFVTLQADDHTYAYARTYFSNRVIVVFNKNRSSQTISLPLPQWYQGLEYQVQFGAAVTPSAAGLDINLPPNSFEILTY